MVDRISTYKNHTLRVITCTLASVNAIHSQQSQGGYRIDRYLLLDLGNKFQFNGEKTTSHRVQRSSLISEETSPYVDTLSRPLELFGQCRDKEVTHGIILFIYLQKKLLSMPLLLLLDVEETVVEQVNCI